MGPPIETITDIKSKQVSTSNPALGVNCMDLGTCDMKEQSVIETLHSKKSQILLATQLVKMILKIDDVRSPAGMEPVFKQATLKNQCQVIILNNRRNPTDRCCCLLLSCSGSRIFFIYDFATLIINGAHQTDGS